MVGGTGFIPSLPLPVSQILIQWSGNTAGIAGLSLSIATNAYASGFLLLRLAIYSREQKERLAISTITQSTNLHQIMVVLIESGIAIFVGQVAYLLVFKWADNYTVPITPLVSLLYVRYSKSFCIQIDDLCCPGNRYNSCFDQSAKRSISEGSNDPYERKHSFQPSDDQADLDHSHLHH